MASRIFVDTNVLLSGLFFEGNERRLLRHGLEGDFAMVVSEDVLREARGVIKRKFRGSPALEEALILFAAIESRARVILRGSIRQHLGRAAEVVSDVGDVPILAAALEGDIDVLVTGDKELLEAGSSVPFEVLTTRRTLDNMEG